VDRLRKAVEQRLPRVCGRVSHRLLAMQTEIADLKEIEHIGARTQFAGLIERLQTPATLRQRVLRGAQRYSVSDRSQCAGRRA
jgi:hypothetical protein